jgi:hypothetical protein
LSITTGFWTNPLICAPESRNTSRDRTKETSQPERFDERIHSLPRDWIQTRRQSLITTARHRDLHPTFPTSTHIQNASFNNNTLFPPLLHLLHLRTIRDRLCSECGSIPRWTHRPLYLWPPTLRNALRTPFRRARGVYATKHSHCRRQLLLYRLPSFCV